MIVDCKLFTFADYYYILTVGILFEFLKTFNYFSNGKDEDESKTHPSNVQLSYLCIIL